MKTTFTADGKYQLTHGSLYELRDDRTGAEYWHHISSDYRMPRNVAQAVAWYENQQDLAASEE